MMAQLQQQQQQQLEQPPEQPPQQTSKQKLYNVTVIVTSDTCCIDETKDASGTYVAAQLQQSTELFARVTKHCVPDDKSAIIERLQCSLRDEDPALIITIGGTGLCPRDITPEATSLFYEKSCSGIVAALHMAGLRYAPHAALSRLTSGICQQSLIVNFPGSLKACKDCLSCLLGFIEHALEQVRFNAVAYKATHIKIQQDIPKLVNPVIATGTGQANLSDKQSHVRILNDTTNKQRPLVQPVIAQGTIAEPKSKGKKNFRRFGFVRPINNQQQGSKNASHNKQKPTNNQHKAPTNVTQNKQKRPNNQPKGPKNTSQNKQKPTNSQPKVPTNAPQNKQKPTATTTDSSSSRLSIRDVLESRIDPLALINSASELSSSINQKITNPIEGIPTKLAPEKVLITESTFPLINHRKAFDIMSSLSYNLLSEQTDTPLTSFERTYKCLGDILAQNLVPKSLVPPYSVSTMDGYVLNIPRAFMNAINSIKTLPPVEILDNMEQFESFRADQNLKNKFFCCQVNTGCKLPTACFAVIPFEKTRAPMNGHVVINEVKPGSYVRRAGSDLGPKDVLEAGTVIGPAELSMIIAMQYKDIKVLKRPTLGLLSTGDELVNFFSTQDIDENAVIDINQPLLASLFRQKGYKVLNFGIAKDNFDEISHAIGEYIKKCEVLLITGGASMGTKDYVKDVIEHMGGTIHFGRVNIKPGKPASFASILINDKRRFIFSLPGNPVSAYMTSLVLVIPFLEHAIKSHFKAEVPMTLDCIGDLIRVQIESLLDEKEPYIFDGRLEFIRAKISKQEDNLTLATVSLRQQSSCMVSLIDCNCFIMIDPSLKGKTLAVGQYYPALKLHKQL